MVLIKLYLLFLVHYVVGECNLRYFQPEQIHIAFANDESSIMVTWSTMKSTDSFVEYGMKSLNFNSRGETKVFIDDGAERRKQFIHRVTVHNLAPNTTYSYRCGSERGWSSIYTFKTIPNTTEWSPNFAVFGDLGKDNAISLPALKIEARQGIYDVILHVGDFAYDLDRDNARVGDEFMRQIEPIAAYVPYMTCPGNHEEAYNFSNYKARFSPAGGPDNLFYSFNIGPAHIISFSTEYYYYLHYSTESFIYQYNWLEKDLKEATKPENRKLRPWIITMGHRPMYCSTDDGDDCNHENDRIRIGLPDDEKFGLEKLFYDYGVDLEIWGHEHVYERLWPVYDKKVYNGSVEAPYTDPKAPVHVITGSAGCPELVDQFVKNPAQWSAFRSSDYGYTKMKIYNNTHLYLGQTSINKGQIIDHIWLIKHTHGPYGEN